MRGWAADALFLYIFFDHASFLAPAGKAYMGKQTNLLVWYFDSMMTYCNCDVLSLIFALDRWQQAHCL